MFIYLILSLGKTSLKHAPDGHIFWSECGKTSYLDTIETLGI
ncbi:hypothetical protein AB2T69_21060 [Clostridium butyricum]